MEVIKIKDYNISMEFEPLICALGFFDTIHIGHQKLVETCTQIAKNNSAKSAIVTVSKTVNKFGIDVLALEDRYAKLADLGIDIIFELEMNDTIKNSSTDQFIDFLTNINTKKVVCGSDYRFGKDGVGNVPLLKRKFDVKIVEFSQINGKKISTTMIKKALLKGKIKHANKLLGYNYFIKGVVMHGRQIGRQIGIPTANLIVEMPVISKGVYITKTKVNNKWYRSMTNIGVNPTMKCDGLTVETFIGEGFDEDIYGINIEVIFFDKIRDETKFDNVEQLIEQLQTDKKKMEEYIYENSTVS